MPHLKAYDKEGNILAIGYNVYTEQGSVIIPNLKPHTKYPQGEFYVSWEGDNYESEKVVVPEFTTLESSYKEIIFYAKDILIIKPKTAYDIAVDNGFTGTEEEWVKSIKGEPGEQGKPGEPGKDGKSFGFEDLSEEQLNVLKGEQGKPGEPGKDGKSSYELAVEEGFQGELDEYLDSLHGEKGEPLRFSDLTEEQIQSLKGQDGTMAFKDLTEEQKESLKGDKGEPGIDGQDGNDGKDFTYQDFTEEQLENLKGEKGDPFTYQDFTDEQKQEMKGLDENEVKSLIDEPFKQSIEDPYYDEITYDKFFDEESKSLYYVVDIPHKDKNGDIIKLKTTKPKEPTTAREISEKYQPSVISNASVFNTGTLEPSGVQIEDGQIIGDKKSGTLRTLGIKDDNTLVDFTSDVRAQEILDMGIKNTITAFYPIKNGEDKPYKDIANSSANVNEKHPRQVIAQKENKDLMFITIEGRNGDSQGMDYDDMYRICESLGASYAYCLDGGGSTQTLVRGNLINKQVDGNGMKERVVPDFLYVDKKVENKKSIQSYNYDIGKITKTLTEMLYKNSNLKGIPNKVDIVTDLDSIKETGLYWVGKSAKGSPGDMSYAIIHFQVYDNASLQLAIPYHESSSNILFRRTVGTGDTNIWRDWRPNNTTSWSGLTFEPGWSNYGNGEPGLGYSIQGNKVYIKGTVKGSSSNNIIAILPEEIIPKIVVMSPTTTKQGDEYKASAIKISTNGEVEIINPSSEWNLVSLTYPL